MNSFSLRKIQDDLVRETVIADIILQKTGMSINK